MRKGMKRVLIGACLIILVACAGASIDDIRKWENENDLESLFAVYSDYENSDKIRRQAEKALNNAGDSVVQMAMGHLDDPDNSVRSYALYLIKDSAESKPNPLPKGAVEKQAVPKLLEILRKDPNAMCRSNAASTLREIGDVRALKPLMVAIENDPNGLVSSFAETAFKQIVRENPQEALLETKDLVKEIKKRHPHLFK